MYEPWLTLLLSLKFSKAKIIKRVEEIHFTFYLRFFFFALLISE